VCGDPVVSPVQVCRFSDQNDAICVPVTTKETNISDLLPVEALALTVGLAQVLRGEAPSDNVASMCVRALARLDGRHDWTADRDDR